MPDGIPAALAAAQQLRRSPGYRGLDASTRAALDRDLGRLEAALGHDRYALGQDISDLGAKLRASAGVSEGSAAPQGQPSQAAAPAQPAAPTAPAAQTAQLGERMASALQAVDFPAFVASLVTGTFRAIVDATAQQVREYAQLVASLTQSLDDYTRENVTPNQSRDHLAQRYPKDLRLELPQPGTAGAPRVLPRPEAEGQSPAWLSRYGLAGEALTADLTEGPLLEAAQQQVGEERLQTLATMVLMGINRIVVSEGDIRAKLQFHATATDAQKASVDQTGAAIAQSGGGQAAATQMMVSTVKANAQAEASLKADLMGEVRIAFRSETFPLERFADTAAIQLLNRHARWRTEEPAAAPAAPAPAAPPAPAPAVPAAAARHGVTP